MITAAVAIATCSFLTTDHARKMDDPVYLNGQPWTPKEWAGFGCVIAAIMGLTMTLPLTSTPLKFIPI